MLADLASKTDVLFAGFFVVIIAMMVLPMPTAFIDAMIACNLAFAFVVLITTIYLRNILDISTFPAVILIGTMLRLALAISTTRLVLSEGNAGEIISAFGSFVVSGNLVVGLVMFLIVALVQFIVITKGAERIAEVGARFTLDAMPGKQLAIDSDLRSGNVTAEVAQKQRSHLERESQFFGAMDGAMRFVKGDAIAGLVIVAVNLLGGLAIGIFQRGLNFSDSAHLYSVLSVGDGLVSQISSMLMAIAAGMVVTRVIADESSSLGVEIGRQLIREPRAPGIAAATTLAAGFIPGFPASILWPIGFGLAVLALTQLRKRLSETPSGTTEGGVHRPDATTPLDRTKYGDPIVATLSATTMARLEADELGAHLDKGIRIAARSVGVAITVPTFNADPRMTEGVIRIQVENVPAGLIACPADRPVEQVAQDIVRIVRRYVGSIFSVDDATQWLTSLEPRLGKLAIDVRTQVSPTLLVAVIRRLLGSGVTLSQPRGLLETMLKAEPHEQDLDKLSEEARWALSRQIAFGLLDQRGLLPVLSLSADREQMMRSYRATMHPANKIEMLEEFDLFARDMKVALAAANEKGIDPAVIAPGDLRLFTQKLLIWHGCRIPVIAVEEVDSEITIDVISVVGDRFEKAV
jgi:type III secretion protein V